MVFPLYLYTKGSSAGKRLLILWSTWFDFVFKKLVLFPISPFHSCQRFYCQAQCGVRSKPGWLVSTSIQPDRKRFGRGERDLWKVALVQNRHFTELYLELRKSLSIKKDHRYHGIILSARVM